MVDLDFKLDKEMNNRDIDYDYTENILQVNNFKIFNKTDSKELLSIIYDFCTEEEIPWVDIHAIKSKNNKCVKKFLKEENFCILIEKRDTISARKQIK